MVSEVRTSMLIVVVVSVTGAITHTSLVVAVVVAVVLTLLQH